ncbi:hypothetical protein HSB1_02000 [Halogranum salarium B-1]|uniref:Uncharacterized protein n=1 Tax=Halogranum salarium B-1 TaxID=1210908 RepID=J3JHN7_9EURY|nr:hypothetical protein HSB1_02000 [Halogranum salarium B-1]
MRFLSLSNQTVREVYIEPRIVGAVMAECGQVAGDYWSGGCEEVQREILWSGRDGRLQASKERAFSVSTGTATDRR